MKRQIAMVLLLLVLLGCIGGFAEEAPVRIESREDLYAILEDAIECMKQPPVMDAADFPLEWGLESDVRNVYYDLMSARPDLQYAYELIPKADDRMLLACEIKYMPYRTGDFPDGFEGVEVGSLTDLIDVARANLDRESMNIRIVNSDLRVGDMNMALSGQVGNGYLFCQLSSDGTQIVTRPGQLKGEPEFSHEEAFEKLAQIDKQAQKVAAQYTHDGMTQREKARALYGYLTENVVYDYRYYSDFEHFSDKARTPLGALEDHLAICGGFAQALKVLFEQAEIPCYTVSGFAGEDHLWNVAKIDDVWTLFDATFDAGKAEENWRYFDVQIVEVSDHVPSGDIVDQLMKENTSAGLTGPERVGVSGLFTLAKEAVKAPNTLKTRDIPIVFSLGLCYNVN